MDESQEPAEVGAEPNQPVHLTATTSPGQAIMPGQRFCPSCAKPVVQTASVCPQCGTALGAPKPAVGILAPRAFEPQRPAQLGEVVQEVLVGREPRLKPGLWT